MRISYTDPRTVLFIYLQIRETNARPILFAVIFSLCVVHFSFSLLLSSLFSFYHFCCSGHHIFVLAVLIQSLISFLNSLAPHTRIHPPFPIRLFVFLSSISSQTLTKEQKFNINHRKIQKYEKMEMVIDKLPRYQEFEQVLGNITPVNKFFGTQKQFSFLHVYFFTNMYK